MLTFVHMGATFALGCLVLFQYSEGQHERTRFTKKPHKIVYGVLNSHVVFHWKFAFGNRHDWNHFKGIVWGKTDRKRIRDKYITVDENGAMAINPQLPDSLKIRLNVTANITQKECSWKFVLKKPTKVDEKITYGSVVEVEGIQFRDGPIQIILQVLPKITDHSNATIDVEEDDDVRLFCKATGDPKPSIEWKNDGVLLQKTNQNTSQLLIKRIALKDSGNYVCTAVNQAGSASFNVLVRVVKYRPYINKTASSSTIVKSWLSHVTILKCAVDANPVASFTWFKDGRKMSSGHNSAHNTGTLSIKPITTSDFGRYNCTAENLKGTAWHSIAVEQIFVPDPPIINQLEPALLSITATWNRSLDNGGSPILDYKIILLDENDHLLQNLSGITETTYTLLNVKHNRTYKIYLQARNVVGYGKRANRTVSTLDADPPRVLAITAIPSLQAVSISWNSTNDNTGIKIIGYRLILIDTISQHHREFITGNVSSLYVTKLNHNRTYKIMVQAKNEDGFGRFRIKEFTTLEADLPGSPLIEAITLGPFALEINWNSSAQDINNIKILDYRLQILEGPFIRQSYIALTNTSLIVKNLSRNRTYVIKIQARNEIGYGQTANISATTALTGPPDAPSITNTTVSGKLCLLHWEIPYNGESSIEVYTVSVWTIVASNGQRSKQWLNSLNTTQTKYQLNLNWDNNYTIAVSAWNKYGQGHYGIEGNCRTGKFIPEKTTSMIPTSLLTTLNTTVIHSTEETTPPPTEKPTVDKDVGPATTAYEVKKEVKDKTSFAYLAPLWIVVMAFSIPAVMFMLWKGTQKIVLAHCCKSRGGSRQLQNTESESSSTSMEEMKENKGTDHYETITEIVEMQLNHGYTDEDERQQQCNRPKSTPEYPVYNHLFETPLNSGFGVHPPVKNTKQVGLVRPTKWRDMELDSGEVGTTPAHVYSHLNNSDSFAKRESSALGRISTMIPSRCNWEISRGRLQLQRIIGRGQFALIKKGFALNVNEKGGWVPVAVKTLNFYEEEANELYRKDMMSELSLMKRLSPHKNVIQLLACITESEPLCVITEFAPFGDLLGFLRKKRGLQDDYYLMDNLPRRSLTSNQLMQFAGEIADGMAHLSSAKIIHRDLAARNVLLGDNLTCKVTDFGTARDIRAQDFYQKKSGGRLPMKWTAIESLLHGLYTSKSDVWSFGVVLFEIVTMGGCPYPDMEVLELIDRLESGYRMEKPHHIADELYNVMLSCWSENLDMRPTFLQLHSILNQLATKNQDCIDLRLYDGELYQNIQIPSR
ncbi:uncharacterized protein [Montipora foliosa]|uniref:uncharacterized protein isoform X1 n=1 Tax=Montipora foliosa TaxID=591990 RepID=UPI0035F14242